MLSFIVAALAQPSFETVRIEGWTIRLEEGLTKEKAWGPAKAELTRQLQDIKRIVPDGPLLKIQTVTIWVYKKSETSPCMVYHPAAAWLKEHGANPEMAGGVELGNIENFVSWTYEQPWMVMHELAHAYHHQFLENGFENVEVKTVFEQSIKSKKYDDVLHWSGGKKKHYAATNQMEFFAETTESYFGTNDFFPFVRSELMGIDPNAFALMEKIWGKPVKRMLD